jgi:crotonobetainyl-CoA:carnitine CoA-transferase CaiB-like acyl-CoA transferase
MFNDPLSCSCQFEPPWQAHEQRTLGRPFQLGQTFPAGRIYNAADIAQDPHYRARDMLLDSQLDDGTPVTLPGIVPKLGTTPGSVTRSAPSLGQHTAEILGELGIDAAQQADWRQRGII